MAENTEAKLKAFVICENIIRDTNNRASLINIFDSLKVEKLPGNIGLNIFLSFFCVIGTRELKIEMISPSGEKLNTFGQEVLIPLPSGYDLTIQGIFGIKEKGEYTFIAYLDGEMLGEAFLTIHIIKGDEA